MNFRKKITTLEEIEQIAKQVLERMDEPLLEGKKIGRLLLTENEMDRFLMVERGYSFADAEKASGHTHKKKDCDEYQVRIRQTDFHELLATYFHELGHIATLDKIKDLKITGDKETIISETLAYLFEGYAKEKFNELYYRAKFAEVETPDLSRRYIRLVIDESYLDLVHRLALESIYSMMGQMKEATYETLYQGAKKYTFK